MGSSFWKVVVVAVLLLLVAAGLEYAAIHDPDILAQARKMAADSHLPQWLVGLAAPLVYAWKRLLGDWSGAGPKLDGLERDNARIREEQTRLRQDVSALNGWRDQETARQRQEIARIQGDIEALNGRIAANDRRLVEAVAAPPSSYVDGLSPEQIREQARAFNLEHGIEGME